MTSESQAGPDPQDTMVHTRGLPPHAQALPHIQDPNEAMAVTPPSLLRPVILVHGLAQHADTWVGLKNFLTNDPSNAFGGVYSIENEKSFVEGLTSRPKANIFAIDLSDNLASPSDVAKELTRCISLIHSYTGASQVDLVTHSMGALVAREALRTSNIAVDHLVMVAPPNQGSYEANLGLAMGWLHSRYPKDHLGAMKDLRLEYSALGHVSNSYLHGLNESWETDRQKVKATIIAGAGLPTPDRSWTMTAPGDGIVAAHRTPLGDTPLFVAEPDELPPTHRFFRDVQEFRYNHIQIAGEIEVFKKVGELLTDDPPPLVHEPHQISFFEAFPDLEEQPIAPREPQQTDLFASACEKGEVDVSQLSEHETRARGH